MSALAKPRPLPKSLEGEAPTTKIVFLWLEPLGEVSYSVRELAEMLYVAPNPVQNGLTRLRELGLLEDIEPASGRVAGRYRVKR